MMDDIKHNPRKAKDYGDAPNMTKYEKDISFLNRYFVFKKVSERNAEKLTNVFLGKLASTLEFEKDKSNVAKQMIKKP